MSWVTLHRIIIISNKHFHDLSVGLSFRLPVTLLLSVEALTRGSTSLFFVSLSIKASFCGRAV
jgi:hypothetical protein